MTNLDARSKMEGSFLFPKSHSFPPMWTLQTNLQTRQAQFQTWSSIILSYCREKRIWRLTLVDALNTPLFHNVAIRRKLNLLEVREVIDWMTWDEAGQRAQWVAQEEKGSAWIYWRRPEEWAEVLYHWVSSCPGPIPQSID